MMEVRNHQEKLPDSKKMKGNFQVVAVYLLEKQEIYFFRMWEVHN